MIPQCLTCYSFVMLFTLIVAYTYSYLKVEKLLDEDDIPIDFLSQISRDWTVQPFT